MHTLLRLFCLLLLFAATAPGETLMPLAEFRLRQSWQDDKAFPDDDPGSARLISGFHWEGHDTISLRFQWQAVGTWDGSKSGSDPNAREALSDSILTLRDIAFLPLSFKVGRSALIFENELLFGGSVYRDTYHDFALLRLDLVDSGFQVFGGKPAHISLDSPWQGFGGVHAWTHPAEDVRMALVAVLAKGREDVRVGSASITTRLKFSDSSEYRVSFTPQIGKNENRDSLRGWLLYTTWQHQFSRTGWRPGFRVGYTAASGGSEPGGMYDFRPLFNEPLFGMVLNPSAVNLSVASSAVFFTPQENFEINLEARHYYQMRTRVDTAGENASGFAMGLNQATNGNSGDLGWELCVLLDWQQSEWISTRIQGGVLFPGSAFDQSNLDSTVYQARLEMRLRY